MIDLYPEAVFRNFEAICKIPHGSYNTGALADFLVSWAENRKLYVRKDAVGNVIIKKPATPDKLDSAPIVLQGHMDMVAVHDADVDIDMEKEGLTLCLDGEGEELCLHGLGTSLGGDDGIFVAYAMALLEAAEGTISHPALEVIITVEEEVGMEGAAGLDPYDITGRRLLNLDSEDEGILTAGCAGGERAEVTIPVRYMTRGGDRFMLTIEGGLGGHSGQEIDRGRLNAPIELAKILLPMVEEEDGRFRTSLLKIEGGEKDNAIPGFALAELMLTKNKAESEDFIENYKTTGTDRETALDYLKRIAEEATDRLREEYPKDPGVTVVAEFIEEGYVGDAMFTDDALKVLHYLAGQVNGVQEYTNLVGASGDILVKTSLNLGVLTTSKKCVTAVHCLRSLAQSNLESLDAEVKKRAKELAGASTSVHGAYPPWEYEADSEWLSLVKKSFTEYYEREPIVETIHAGLECGLLASKMPGLQSVSIGPQMSDIHTTKEKLYVASVARTWEYLLTILKNA